MTVARFAEFSEAEKQNSESLDADQRRWLVMMEEAAGVIS